MTFCKCFETGLLYISLLVFFQKLNSQSLEILKINTEEYPVIKANFKATDSLGAPVFDITKNNVHVFENLSEREILYLKAPSKFPEPLSVILVFDISGSMKDKRLKIAREAANTFINEIDGTHFELAITTFSNESYINSDFTNNAERLKNVVADISSMGGTCYDSAFMQPRTGIFELAKKARFKKVVVFMTDGLSDAKTDTIISIAQNEGITVYCTTIELPMPDLLKDISQETGGDYYPKLNDPEKASDIYKDLYNEIVSSDMGTVKWLASGTCEKDRQVEVNIKKLSTHTNYSLSERAENNFRLSPSSFFISQGVTKKETQHSIYLKAIERPVTVNGISTNSPENIKIEELAFPFILEVGQSKNIKFTFNRNDTGKFYSQIILETEDCLEKQTLDVFFKEKGKIEVISPKGGEVYAVGTEIKIQWKGVPKNQEVALFYKNENQSWKKIGNATGLEYIWTSPKVKGEKYQVKVQTVDGYERTATKRIEGINGINSLYDISNDGSMVVYGNRGGYINIAHLESENILKSDRTAPVRYAFFSSNNENIIKYYRNSLYIQEIFNNQPAEYSYATHGKIVSSFCSNTGDEYLMPSEIDPLNYPGNQTKIIEKSNNYQVFVNTGKSKTKYAAVTNDHKLTVVLLEDYNLFYVKNEKNSLHKIDQLSQGLSRIIVSPYGKYCFIEYPLNARVVRIKSGKTVFFTNNDIYLRFSPDGNKLMTIDSIRQINVWDFEKEKKIISFQNSKLSNFSPSGRYIHYYQNNYVYIFDLESEIQILKQYLPGVSRIHISPDDKEFLVIRNAIAEIYEIATGEPTTKISTLVSGGIWDAFFDVNGNIISFDESKILLWEPQMTYSPGISNTFRLISPQPDVLPFYNLGKHEIGRQLEVTILEIIKNKTTFPVKIESILLENDDAVFEIISGNEPFTLQPREAAEIEIGFSPEKITRETTNLIISTPDSSFVCRITGEGIEKKFELPGKTIDFGKIPLYSMKDTTAVLLKNISNNKIEIIGIINNGPDIGQFEIVQKSEKTEIFPGEMLIATLKYNALYNGLASGTIAVHFKNSSQPVIINLLGEAFSSKDITIYGKVLNSADNSVVEANMFCRDINLNRNIFDGISDPLNGFRFYAGQGKRYLLYAEKEGYISGSEMVDLSRWTDTDSVEKNIIVSKLSTGNTFRLNGVFFIFAKAELISTSINDLNRVLLALESNPSIKLEIHGHTDNIGSNENNMVLSERRALTIKDYFKENGIAENRLFIKSFGESHPIADNGTEEGRQMNRRVEFVILE